MDDVVANEVDRGNHMPLLLKTWICTEKACSNYKFSCWVNSVNALSYHYPIYQTTTRKWAAAINESNSTITIEAPLPALVPAMVMATTNRRQTIVIPLPVASSGSSSHQTFNINVSSTPSSNSAAAAANPPSLLPTIDTMTDDDELLRLFFTKLRA